MTMPEPHDLECDCAECIEYETIVESWASPAEDDDDG